MKFTTELIAVIVVAVVLIIITYFLVNANKNVQVRAKALEETTKGLMDYIDKLENGVATAIIKANQKQQEFIDYIEENYLEDEEEEPQVQSSFVPKKPQTKPRQERQVRFVENVVPLEEAKDVINGQNESDQRGTINVRQAMEEANAAMLAAGE